MAARRGTPRRFAPSDTPPPPADPAPPAGGDGGGAGDDAEQVNVNDLISQLDDILDGAVQAVAGIDLTGLDPKVQTFISLVGAADLAVDALMAKSGVDDPDEPGSAAPDDADQASLAEAADAVIVAAKNAGSGATGGPAEVQTAIDAIKDADEISGLVLAALQLPDPDEGGDVQEPPAPDDVPEPTDKTPPPAGDKPAPTPPPATPPPPAPSGAASRGRRTLADDPPAPPADDTPAPAGDLTFRMPVMVLEGVETGDGRYIKTDALSWRELPIPVMGILETGYGHDGAELIGRIDSIERVDASGFINPKTGEAYGNSDEGTPVQALVANGEFADLDTAQKIYDLIEKKFLRGVSVDLSEVVSELELLDSDEGDAETEADLLDEIFFGGEFLEKVVEGRVMGATVCPFPAFEGAYIEVGSGAASTPPEQAAVRPSESHAVRVLDTFGERECEPCADGQPLVASAGPMAPPASWFMDPDLDGPTPLTIEEDGRVYGHLATWGTCHTSFQGRCVTAPKSRNDYAYFMTGAVRVAEGELIATGPITLGTGHADTKLSTAAALAHYDNTGMVVADVAAGEDAHGIWVAGAARPNITPLQVRQLRAAALSGDWRQIGPGLELVAALAVNSPGFPIVRARTDHGATRALVAAGARGVLRGASVNHAVMSEILRWKRGVDDELATIRVDRMRERVHGGSR